MFFKIKPVRFSKDPQDDRSLHHSIKDGMANSIMLGAGETYFTAFALFLKVTTAQVGLISTLPPLLGSFAQLASMWINRRIKVCKPIILTGVILQACLWIPLMLLILYPPEDALLPLLMVLTFYYAAAHFAAPTWTRLIGDLVPEQRRGRYFAQRNRLISIMTLLALSISGIVLHYFDSSGLTSLGFIVIFVVACVARLVSAWHINKMHEPVVHATELESPKIVFSAFVHSGALWFTLYFVLMQMVVSVASPFFAVYMLRDMQFTYIEFMANTGTAVLVQFATLKMWGRMGDSIGHRVILIITGFTIPLLPLLWVVTDNFWYLLMVQVLAGLFWGGFSLACCNLLFDLVPSAHRVSYVAVHNVLVATGVFLGGLTGVILIGIVPERSTWFGDQSVMTPLLNLFLISTVLRVLISIVFIKKIQERRKVLRPRSHREFFFRITRFNAFMGLMYDFVTEWQPDKLKKPKASD